MRGCGMNKHATTRMASAIREITLLIILMIKQGRSQPIYLYPGNSSDTSNNTLSPSFPEPVDHSGHKCTYRNLQYCHSYIRNSFYFYTNSGGWILLAIVVCGLLLQSVSHLLASRTKKEVAFGIVQATNFQMRLNYSQHLGGNG